MATAESSVSYERDVKPLFRERDRNCMTSIRHFDLYSYDDVRKWSKAILEQLERGLMPKDGAWPAEKVEIFRVWTTSGMAP